MTTLKMKDLVEARIEEVRRQNPNWEPGLLLSIVRGFIADVSKRVAAQDIPFWKFPAASMDLVGKMNVDFDRERDTINVKVISSASDDGQSPMDQIDSCVRDYFYIHLFQRISRYVVMELDGHEYKARFLMQSQAPSGESALEETERLKSILARPFVVGREELPLEELDENGSVRILGHTPVLVFPRSDGSSAEILGLEVEFKPLTIIRENKEAFYPLHLRVTGNSEALASLDEESFSWLCGMAVKEIDRAIKHQADLNKLSPYLLGLANDSKSPSLASGHDRAGTEIHPAANMAKEGNCFLREGRAWKIRFNGKERIFKEYAGFRLIKELLTMPGKRLDAQELDSLANQDSLPELFTQQASEFNQPGFRLVSGDAAITESEKERLLARVDELEQMKEEAMAALDKMKARECQDEIEEIFLEIRKRTDQNGNSRPVDDQFENARKRTSKAIKRAIRSFSVTFKELHEHLKETIDFGSSLSYRPNPPVEWET